MKNRKTQVEAKEKKERELQKEYNDKSIRIMSGKKFTKGEALSRKDRGNLIKEKDLLCEILKIIKKYLPQLTNLFNKLTDKRHKSYVIYKMRTIIMTRLFALICGITTMTEMTTTFNTDEAIKNLSSICNQDLKEIPDWQIEDIRKYIVKTLIRSKMFDKYRYNKAFQLLVDATGISSHDYNLNGNCITKKSKNGIIKYYK